jgi:phosphate transport system permease protein
VSVAVAARRMGPGMPAIPVLVGLGSVAVGAAAIVIVAFLVTGVGSGMVDWLRLLSTAAWVPAAGDFGAAAMIFGTLAVSAIALLAATPIGWGSAVAITELVPPRHRGMLRAGVELLAAVPSIVYGLIGIAVVRPMVSRVFDIPGGDSLLAAGLVLAVMILPTITAVSTDALTAVPASAREAAATLGLTRQEVIRAAVLPAARKGMLAAVLLGLARALGETIAVFLVIGRLDGRLPNLAQVPSAIIEPGQTLTTKLGGPEPLLAGTAGAHWAALCALGLLLLVLVASITIVALVLGDRATRPRRSTRLRRSRRGRPLRERLGVARLRLVLAVPFLLIGGVAVMVASNGRVAANPRFWLTPAIGASGGGVRDQLLGTLLLTVASGVLAAPLGLCVGLLLGEYAGPRLSRMLRTLLVTLGGVPSILLGLVGYAFLSTWLGWGKSWLAGSIVLATIVIPVAAMATAARLDALPPERREAALALGLRRSQLIRSVLLPWAAPGLLTGSLLGLARAVGETAPLLFTVTIFSGAGPFPRGVIDAPVVALPTHVFTLAQDAADPAARQAAWGSSLVLLVLAALLLSVALPMRRRLEPSV